MKSFSELGLAEPLLRAIQEQGYHTPTPIQMQAIPPVLTGRDLIGCAQTGTGKTAAFALPLLQTLAGQPRVRTPRALVVSPTRELAAQIAALGTGTTLLVDTYDIEQGVETAIRVAGTGLGLTIVRSIVEAHGGVVSLESTPGEGTSVCVLLHR